MIKFISLILCVGFVLAQDEHAPANFKLPPGTINCQIDHENRDECIKEAIQDMLPKAADGIEALRIPAIDPYYVERYATSYRRGEQFAASGVLRDIRIYGASKAQLKEVKTEITKTHIKALYKAHIPRTNVEGYYKGEGRFNGIKIKSKGYFNMTASDIDIVSRTEGDIITVDGVKYIHLTKFDITPTFGKMKLFATGIFPDPELNRFVLEFINQNWPMMYRELMPESKKRMEPIILAEANNFLSYVPMHKMLYYGQEPKDEVA